MSAIVTLLDGPDCARSVLPVASVLRDVQRGRLHVVNVGEESTPPKELFERHGLDPRGLGGCVVTHCASADVAHTLLALAAREGGAPIVMCTRGASDAPERSFGEHARGVLGEANVPVVLVRPGGVKVDWALEEVLLPHDGSPATTAAIRPAAELAQRAEAKLLALHVATPGTRPVAEPGSIPVPRYVDQPQHEWPSWAGEFLERLGSTSTLDPARVRLFLGQGEAGAEVLRVANAEGADLIVLAWHGTLDEEHAKVFKALLRHAPCPMMVLRVPAR